MNGHTWNDDRCELCGDKDWYADKYCSKNPNDKEKYDKWIEEQRAENTGETAQSN